MPRKKGAGSTETPFNLNVKLDREEDADIIQGLKKRGNSALTKNAIRFYLQLIETAEKNALERVHQAPAVVSTQPQTTNAAPPQQTTQPDSSQEVQASGDELFGSWE
ncbi:hypothetical protein GCM10011571_16980 [Marinithermofilum abyssi]|uniref:Uncharacterized protein n=1 Tax=Marinithermofilum abyssi TaxID=1571185 RepID=A0A8J2VHU5_9BACL|nr:hypothetical protein [Marinithermofilum abyssi]GGE15972.1 hypothetical protein GCM10011571_16980 [Marinithermofilum abyssi]